MSDILIAPDGGNDSTEISILLEQQAFVDMVLNFLGKKERLSYRVDNDFILRLNDIEQFHHLLEAKLAKEHTTHVSHFAVTVLYHDGTSKQVNGIEALQRFNETRNVLPVSVTLSWNIILNFPKLKSIESQAIELNFLKNKNSQKSGKIELTINHTNSAWGVEVLNLID